MEDRLQKILSAYGLASRREAERMLQDGRVRVNGVPVGLGARADPERDRIELDGSPLTRKGERVYIMLNKPRGYVTTMHDERGRRTVAQLVADCGARVYPVGRLDMDSDGLLLMTNDGELANRLTHPSFETEKTYRVRVVGPQAGQKREALSLPMQLDGVAVQAKRVELLRGGAEAALYEITIGEGRNRQIRRMCALCGLRVVRLTRIREGAVQLGALPSGKWRHLTEEEVRALFAGN